MGQKVNPHGLRVGVIKPWDAQWYADKKTFGANIKEDNDIRTFIKKKYYDAAISKITVIRAANKVEIGIYTGRPGVLIGKGGEGVNQMKEQIKKIAPGKQININIYEINRPDVDAQLVAESIAAQLEKRAAFRRTMKQAISRAMKGGAKGIKTMCSGRLDGAEIARSESYHEGSIPLQTLRADIDYATAEAHTTFGIIGVKVWIYKGEVLGRGIKKEGGKA